MVGFVEVDSSILGKKVFKSKTIHEVYISACPPSWHAIYILKDFYNALCKIDDYFDYIE